MLIWRKSLQTKNQTKNNIQCKNLNLSLVFFCLLFYSRRCHNVVMTKLVLIYFETFTVNEE